MEEPQAKRARTEDNAEDGDQARADIDVQPMAPDIDDGGGELVEDDQIKSGYSFYTVVCSMQERQRF